MAIDLKFSKTDPTSNWGFRVVGGADFQQPLVVVKVNEDSLAETAGLRTGDIIVNVNSKSTATLTHFEVHEAISSAGAEFILGIKRGEFVPPEILQDEGKEIEVFLRDVQVLVDEEIIDKAEELADTLGKEIFAEFGQHKAKKTMTKKSNEKMMFSNSTQTYVPTEDKYKQNKWSTFLLKPERPIPKPNKVIEQEKIIEENAYKIIIKKQSRRKSLPKEKRVQFNQNISEIEIRSNDTLEERDGTHSPELDSLGSQAEPDSLEENNNEEYYRANNIYERDEEKYSNESEECSECHSDEVREYDDDDINFENLRKDSIGMEMKFKPISEIIVDPNSDFSMTLEEQLRAVQKQLQALSQLPSAVQLTLDAVSKQLAEIVSSKEDEENENDIEDENDQDEGTASQEAAEAESGEDTNSVVGDELDDDSIADEELKAIMERARLDGEHEEEKEQEDLEELARIKQEEEEARQRAEEERQREEEERRKEEELAAKKEKEMEDQQKATFRPIVLPGGRKWIDPDDVVPTRKPKMTDEKIMETIDSNLEVIAGKRKGINFMKYTPPPKNLDHLQNSEVYRLIHGMEPPTRGITIRPEKIMPEQDYYQAGHENV
ncbi:uncharacterized protein [Diabrotica undecimpunctata]|uniref:uncharacterized protein isoform X2 n=1 Tax=Diabrotica undecimpunctata TaxID=50387 RepID=UPI003B637073